jgi:TPR repeat protein
MNSLGNLFKNGVPGLLAANPEEAFRLFAKAAEMGYLDAQGNLGVLYINGIGVARDENKAVQLFQDGAKKDNALCQFYYAMCLQGGVGVQENAAEARSLYIRSAKSGNREAIKWCRENNVPLTNSP